MLGVFPDEYHRYGLIFIKLGCTKMDRFIETVNAHPGKMELGRFSIGHGRNTSTITSYSSYDS